MHRFHLKWHLASVQALRTDKLPGEYLIVGTDLDGNPVAMVVTR